MEDFTRVLADVMSIFTNAVLLYALIKYLTE
jgi:hypothetical protein